MASKRSMLSRCDFNSSAARVVSSVITGLRVSYLNGSFLFSQTAQATGQTAAQSAHSFGQAHAFGQAAHSATGDLLLCCGKLCLTWGALAAEHALESAQPAFFANFLHHI